MNFDWKKLIGSIAPTIATALGGPLAGVATSAISQAVLGKPDGEEAEIAEALQTASPDLLLKIKQVDAEFATKMKELDVDLVKIAASDRDSARRREVDTQDKTTKHLAYCFTIGFFAVLGAELWIAVKGIVIAETALRTLDVTLGILFGMMLGVKEYYFGSSASSTQKTNIIAASQRKQ